MDIELKEENRQDYKRCFEQHMRFERQLSEVTIQNYLGCLKKLSQACNKDLADVTEEDISRFLRYLKEKNLSKSSIANFITALRTFYKWVAYKLRRDNIFAVNYFLSNIVKIKKEKKVVSIPSVSDINKLRRALVNYKQAFSLNPASIAYKRVVQARAIFELLITTGMRSGELRNLRYMDIDLG